ncbi:MAG: protein translocase subunit SecF [archaeon]
MEEPQKEKKDFGKEFEKFHDKYYKLLLLIPVFILLVSFSYMFLFYKTHNDFILKDISLTGGTSVTIYAQLDTVKLKEDLSEKLESINTKTIYDIITGDEIAVVVETKTEGETTTEILEDHLGYKLTEENSSIEFTGSVLSDNFYRQLLMAVFYAFLFMAVVVFIIFRKFIPSFAVIISAFADIFMTLTVANFLGIKMSSAGIVAFLMLIGYSVDTDILLTNRLLKSHDGSLNERIVRAFKTGITMTLTSLFAIALALILVRSFSNVLNQIFTILVIGLCFDILNTWITNVSLLKWYVRKNEN